MTTTTTAGATINLMREINAAFNARDVDRILSFFAEDATFLMARGCEPCGRRVHGREAIGRVLADRFTVISGMRWDYVDLFLAGNRAVSVWAVTGQGSDDEVLTHQGFDIYEFRGDKILNKDTYWGRLGEAATRTHRQRLRHRGLNVGPQQRSKAAESLFPSCPTFPGG